MSRQGLSCLPRELVDHICSFFEPADALMLSSTCESLRAALSSENGQLWYRYLSHNEEVSQTINKYKTSYKQDDFKPLAAILPIHLSEPIRVELEIFHSNFHQTLTDTLACNDHLHNKFDRAIDHLEYLCDPHNPPFREGMYKDWKNHPDFFEAPFGEYDKRFDYRRMVLSTLLGRSDIPCCRVCMKPSGLFPEMWSVQLEFEVASGSNDSFRDTEYVLCKDCLPKRLISCDVAKFLGVDMAKFRRASLPKIQSKISHFCRLLEKAKSIADGAYGGPHSRDYKDFRAMAKGPVNFVETVVDDSVYKYFFDIPYDNQGALKFLDEMNKPRNSREILRPRPHLYFLSEVEKAVKKQTGYSIEEHRLMKMLKLDRLPEVMEEVYRVLQDDENSKKLTIVALAKERGLFYISCIQDLLDDHLKEFLDAQNLSMKTHPNSLQKAEQFEIRILTHAVTEDEYEWGTFRTKKLYGHITNIFGVLDYSPPSTGSNSNNDLNDDLNSWVSKSASKIIAEFFRKPSLPLLPEAPLNETVNEWVWEISASKFSKWQCDKAGLCQYCEKSNDYFDFYTPYEYAIHLYLYHRANFLEDKVFGWRFSKGEGITHAAMKVVEAHWSDLERRHRRIEYGPLCTWSI